MKRIKRKRLSAVQRHQIVLGYEKSGLSPKEYVRKVGIGLSTLNLWQRQGRMRRKPRFVEVGVAMGGAAMGGGAYRLTLVGGVRLEVSRGFETAELREMLMLLRERP